MDELLDCLKKFFVLEFWMKTSIKRKKSVS